MLNIDFDQRGLRFKFNADAELRLQNSPEVLRARVTELSLHGCFLETARSFQEQERLSVKILKAGESFESQAEVVYSRPLGVGLIFVELDPRFRTILQKWMLATLDREAEEIPAN
jgi:hypothetical protein